jgi:hypothetical protein
MKQRRGGRAAVGAATVDQGGAGCDVRGSGDLTRRDVRRLESRSQLAAALGLDELSSVPVRGVRARWVSSVADSPPFDEASETATAGAKRPT